MTITPGYGLPDLHLRESREDIVARFGSPSKRRKSGSFREYWLYPKHNFDCLLSSRSGKVLSIFLQKGSGLGDDVLFASSHAQILSTFGQPEQEGEGFLTSSGEYAKQWMWYSSGISFDFDTDGSLSTVSIYAKRQRKKVELSERLSSPLRLAACRR